MNEPTQIEAGTDGYHWKSQPCPICGTMPKKRLGRRGGPAHRQGLGVSCEVWRCSTCSLVFPNPMPLPVGGAAQHYGVAADEYFGKHDEGDKHVMASKIVSGARDVLGRTGDLLDVGAGRGEVLTVASREGWRATGIEVSQTFADYAEKSSGVKILRRPLLECGLPAESFDIVILGGVLEHLYDPDDVIREISRILRPGGALFLDVPNEEGLYFRLGNAYYKMRGRDWVVNLSPTFPPFHVFGFGPRSLRKLLGKHGLSPVRWKFFGGSTCLPTNGGLRQYVELQATRAVTRLSNLGRMGTFIQTWAVKR